MNKSDVKLGIDILDTKLIKIENEKYYLKCNYCGKEFVYKWDGIRRRKSNFCKCKYDINDKIIKDLTGKIFGDLKVIKVDIEKTNNSNEKYSKRVTIWECECIKCGNISYNRSCDLNGIIRRKSSGCGRCFGDWIKDKKFGRLIAVEYQGRGKGESIWRCKCDCENEVNVAESSLKSGNTKSCGCIRNEFLRELGRKRTENKTEPDKESERIYNIYTLMKSRCYNENNENYHHYGGRGVFICEEWLNDYFAFKTWSLNNGYKNNLTIDRIDVNGNYEPSNCRWATQKVQCNNKRNNKYITYKGRTQTLSEWCDELGLEYFRTKARFNTCNMTPEQAFELPKQQLRRKVNL